MPSWIFRSCRDETTYQIAIGDSLQIHNIPRWPNRRGRADSLEIPIGGPRVDPFSYYSITLLFHYFDSKATFKVYS